MADRRMFTVKVTESDAFYSLPLSAQALYLHLNQLADDDGFINNSSSVAGRISGGKSALKTLVERRFLLQFGPVYVVKHWRMANSLKNDRLKPLAYPEIAKRIWVKPNRVYTDHPVDGCVSLFEKKTGIHLESERNPLGIHLDSQPNRTEKNRIEPNRTEGMESGFGVLWSEYPELRRGAKTQAEAAYKQAIQTDSDAEQCLKNLECWKASEQWHKEGGQYVPYLSNWLERGLWNVAPTSTSQSNASRELDSDELDAIRRMMEQDGD